MSKYIYKAMRADGTSFTAEMTAKSTREVVDYLNEKQYYPVTIKKAEEAKGVQINLQRRTKAKDLAVFCKQLSAMMEAGMPIINSIDIMMTQATNKVLKKTVHDMYEDLNKGSSFSDSLKKHPLVFPELMLHMVESGEISGNIDDVLKKLAIHYEKDAKIMRKVKGAMIYPVILAFAATVMVIFMLTFIFPTFVAMFESTGVELPGITMFVMGISDSIRKMWYIYIIIIGGIIAFYRFFSKSPGGRKTIDKTKLKIPLVNRLIRMIATTRFTRTLATLLYSGVPLLQALENVSQVVGNVIFEEGIIKVRDEVRRGQELAVQVKRLELFPPMVDNMIRIGEESGTLDDILEKTADYFDEELEATIQQLTTMFEPLLILIMGVVIGFIVIAMALPLFDVMKTVG
ncbi:MAG: type II secretion system F family protein [Clostridiales bacterium]|nr:type II secretion system F family protein [Clostridiales bacterium]